MHNHIGPDRFTRIELLVVVATIAILILALPLMLHADSGRGRNKKLYAVPTPGKVATDGKLDDWDLSGRIFSFVSDDTKAERNARFAVMYDDDALYISAEIADQSPMMNRHSPRADADKAWMGDCVQFRLVSDRTQPYPLQAGNLGNADPNREAGQPLHLMIWYFTDNQEPALQIHKSMAMDPVREEWAPHGVVPKGHFEAAYQKADDGKSYVLEYRIPWSTLNAKDSHPIAGDIVTATVQFLWSDGTGLNMDRGGTTYDVMSSPGFPWQTTACWGKMLFRKKGDVPRAWIEPFTAPEEPEPLEFTYEVPRNGEVSVALFDQNNRIVKHIVAQGARRKGTVTDTWNGQTMQGKPLPVGKYTWKGLIHDPITTRYVMSVANSGQPAWKTADGTGGWGGDYGPPTAAAQAGDRMILGWTGHEAGWGIIATDLNGKKLWGAKQKNAAFLATDGQRFFAPAEHHGTHMNVYAAKNGQPLAFGNGRQGLQPPPGNEDQKANKPTGVAYHDGTLYVSFGGRDLIGVYDAVSGDLQRTIQIKAPGRLAVMADGRLFAISGDRVVTPLAFPGRPFGSDEHIDKPLGLAVANGEIYIANAGKLQCVTVFDAAGNYQRTIGKRGGRPLVGAWEKRGMRQPAGIHVDTNGILWVPEAIGSPKRLSRWNAKTGAFVDEFFGGNSYSPFMWIDPENPKEAFFNNTIWDIDLDKGTWYPKSVFYRRMNGNMVNTGHGGFFYPYRVFTAGNGRQYAISKVHGFGPVFWIREGDLFHPLYFMFKNYPNHVLMNYPPFENMKDKKEQYPAGKFYVWSDTNGDMEAQLDELTEIRVPRRQSSPFFNWMDKKLNLYGQNAIYRPTRIDQNGIPHYDFQNPEKLDIEPPRAENWVDPEGTTIWGWRNRGRGDIGFAQHNLADRQMSWAYPPLKGWHAAINDGIPQPGELVGPTCPMGVAGRYTGLISYFGTAELVRDDGLFVAQVFEHGAKGNNGPNIFYVELLAGQLLQPKGSDKYYILAGDQDCRVMEVLGLNTVTDLPGGTYHHTQELAHKAAAAMREYEALVARGQPLSLARGGLRGLTGGDVVGKSVDARRGFKVRAGYDADNLYFRYDVQSPSPLINAVTDPRSIFKGGNLIDIQLAANPKADPDRKKPAAGDVRLLISKNPAGKVWAVVLRPVVEGFKGERIKLESPTGHEFFDVIERTDRVRIQDLKKIKGGFTVTVVVPRDLVGLPALEPGDTVRMDVGYVFGDKGGTNAAVRAYWHNNSFTANVVNDVPHESRLEPHEWGDVLVE